MIHVTEQNKRVYLVGFGSGWFFERFETMSIEKIPGAILTNNINQAARFEDINCARRVAGYYVNAFVTHRDVGIHDYIPY